jgi:hypothetical protein
MRATMSDKTPKNCYRIVPRPNYWKTYWKNVSTTTPSATVAPSRRSCTLPSFW